MEHKIVDNVLFLSTPSARRATSALTDNDYVSFNFYPRPPRGGRRAVQFPHLFRSDISIHALREEGDIKLLFRLASKNISIHALREEGDLTRMRQPNNRVQISIHALREEGDWRSLFSPRTGRGFLSTPSARRATSCPLKSWMPQHISIHALREEGDLQHLFQRSGG